MDLMPYVTRLAAEVQDARKVGALMDLASAEESAPPSPSLFVAPLSERVADNPFAGDFTQRVVVRLGVVIALRSARQDGGSGALTELEILRNKVRLALAGWSPSAEIGWARRSAGRLLRYDAGLVWWLDEYLVEFYERIDLS